MASAQWMIYGATGYTGRLVVEEAIARGARPIVAGRDAEAVTTLARRHDLDFRILTLDSAEELRRGLIDIVAVLHCAGPFAWTSRPMVDACLATGTHYLDITGEIDVFEAIHQRDTEARSAHSVLLPGVGFDVVPTDCLAARLASELPAPTHLELAFFSDGGGMSAGTMRTMIEHFPAAGAVRRDGKIEPVPVAWDARAIEFSCGPRWAMTIPWGDVSTAFHSTGIPNIRVYTGVPPRGVARARRLGRLGPLLGLPPIKRALQWWVGKRVVGPDATARETGRTFLWGRVENERRRGASATFDMPEGYAFTAVAAVDAALRVVAGEVPAGAATPSAAFGSGYVEGLAGVSKIVVNHDG